MRMKFVVIVDVVGKEFRQLEYKISPFNKNEEMLNLIDRILRSMHTIFHSKLEGFKIVEPRNGFDACFSVMTPKGKDWVWFRISLVKDEEATSSLEFKELEVAEWVCSGLR